MNAEIKKLVCDMTISRRKKVQAIVAQDNTVLFWSQELADCLEWLMERDVHSIEAEAAHLTLTLTFTKN